MTLRCSILLIFISGCVGAASCSREERAPTAPKQPLIVYSSLADGAVRTITEAYSKKTGLTIHYMLDSGETLIGKLAAKEHRPTGDVLLISGADQLASAVETDVLRPTTTERLQRSLSGGLSDPDNYWHGLSTNAVVIVYDKRSVEADELSTYATLGDEKWAKRLCLPVSTNESGFAIVASLIVALGEREAEVVVRAWMNNLAAPVFDVELELLSAVQSQRCEVGIVSTDVVAALAGAESLANIGLYWPSASVGGVQWNVTGIGVTRHAQNPEDALLFIEWLTSVDGQEILSGILPGFPTNVDSVPLPPFDGWSGFDASKIDAARLGYVRQETVLLNERARFR